jgi:hypothetical protein
MKIAVRSIMEPNLLNELLDSLKTFLADPAYRFWVYLFLAGIAALAASVIVRRVFRKRRKQEPPLPPELHIELTKLVDNGPPPGPPVFEFFNLPVRLAGIVLAPVGRLRELPPENELPEVFESVMPGLNRIVKLHQPVVRCWPTQVSTRGFASAFFSNINLPGTMGKGTPWSAVAGIFKHQEVPMMLGLVLRAATPNSLGQIVVNAEHEWLGCLRVKQS